MSTVKPFWKGLTFQVLTAMVLGIALGFVFPELAVKFKILGDIFLKLIKTAVAPLIFFTVVHGIASAGDIKKVGKIGIRALIYFELISTLALALGLGWANLLNIGSGMGGGVSEAATSAVNATLAKGHAPTSTQEFIYGIFPDNFIGAFAGGQLLQVLVISIIFGFALLALRHDKRSVIENGMNRISECFFEFINLIMRLAPLGAFGSVAYAVGSNGSTVLLSLFNLVMMFYIAVAFFIFIVLGVICRLSGFSLMLFLKYIKDEIIIVLGTASSESALPRLLQKLEQFGCSRQSVGLILPTGYAFNLDGTSIYMSMCTLFIANAYGIDLSWQQQLGILAVMLVTSKGAAAVSGGSFVVFAATVATVGHLPVEGLALIFGVYRFMSMAIATCNTIGNSVATVVVSRWCGEFAENEAKKEYTRRFGRRPEASL
ncbi:MULTISPECIES: cation:dicarboxylate symporter family transporter [Klebsiella]|uniref:Aerobic C4-dicarboxylate transporter n=1 Tax=Klebsiella variicola TaxID=244366 RepID=A0ABD7PES6_KLEVA|nr:cation:dicarboxylase symporter family transporter [Klebsiella variicola]MCD9672778.1 cation:dicarboxylase symporter family transporter [Klebsiella variicola subsp. variicola]MCK6050137.1 cation:dicarboxylase symporter family transporter [Klebsiella variicola]PXL43360.1 dicarboxylate/amino acid:cation symporter [Klebsiella variicola]SXF98528.1 Aerobic C4-dicarboxylate transporter [Klebsiella variicola]